MEEVLNKIADLVRENGNYDQDKIVLRRVGAQPDKTGQNLEPDLKLTRSGIQLVGWKKVLSWFGFRSYNEALSGYVRDIEKRIEYDTNGRFVTWYFLGVPISSKLTDPGSISSIQISRPLGGGNWERSNMRTPYDTSDQVASGVMSAVLNLRLCLTKKILLSLLISMGLTCLCKSDILY